MRSFKQKTLEQVCAEFNVQDVYELDQLHLIHDQKHIEGESFNANNETLVNNQIKDALMGIELSKLEEDERLAVQDILWLWYHHATTVEIWQNKDFSKAMEYCKKALKYLYPGHPNKITPMLYMALNGDIHRAKKWAETEVNAIEYAYAIYIIDEYEKGSFTV